MCFEQPINDTLITLSDFHSSFDPRLFSVQRFLRVGKSLEVSLSLICLMQTREKKIFFRKWDEEEKVWASPTFYEQIFSFLFVLRCFYVLVSDSKLLDFQFLDCSNSFSQRPGLPGGLELKLLNKFLCEKNVHLLQNLFNMYTL